MAGKQKINMTSLGGYADEHENAAVDKIDNTHSKLQVPPEPKKKVAKEDKKYLRLDITEHQNYISVMADHSKVSMTKYINNLIEADMQQNKETYNKLVQLAAEIERLKSGI